MDDLRFVSIWEAKRSKNGTINCHSHTHNELVYYRCGNGETKIGGKAFSFSDQCFAIIPRRVEHNELHRADAEVICLGFLSSHDLSLGFYTDPSYTIYKILNALLNEAKNQKYGYADMLKIKLHELLLHISRNEINAAAATKDFTYIINYIKENFHENITLSDCAKQLNLSYDYFQHKFKTITGFSPQQFLIEQRLLASEKMLAENRYSCTEIAYRCGFSTSAQFSALFKKRYGTSPLKYKAHHN